MAATKTCPSCGEDVPVAAARCKECFHDFSSAPKRSAGPLALLAAVAGMAVIGAGTFWYISSQPLEEKILVDQETRSVIFTTHFRDGPKTDRLEWDNIAKLEYVTTSGGKFEIAALTLDGERVIIQQGEKPMNGTAEHYSKLMDKPLEMVDNTRGFHKMGDNK